MMINEEIISRGSAVEIGTEILRYCDSKRATGAQIDGAGMRVAEILARALFASPVVSIQHLDGEPRHTCITFVAPGGQSGMMRVENTVGATMTGSEPQKAILAWCEARRAEWSATQPAKAGA